MQGPVRHADDDLDGLLTLAAGPLLRRVLGARAAAEEEEFGVGDVLPKGQTWKNPRWDGGVASWAGCDDLFVDSPLAVWEEDLIAGRISRTTMEGQVGDILDAESCGGDVSDITDRIEERYGTVDLDEIDFNDVWWAIDASNKLGGK